MTIPKVLLPDVEQAVIDFLTADVEVTADVGSEVPVEPSYPLAVVERIGGVPNDVEPRWLDRASVRVRVQGETKAEAHDAAAACEASLFTMRGLQANGAVVSGVRSVIGLQWLPDESGQPQYVFQVAIAAHPS